MRSTAAKKVPAARGAGVTCLSIVVVTPHIYKEYFIFTAYTMADDGADSDFEESWAASEFVPYWTQRISASIVSADARRCHRRIPRLKRKAMATPAGHPGRRA
jgi:hypothetical protein